MTLAFIIAVILVLAASFILGFSLAATAFLVGWTVLMAFAFRFAETISEGNAAAKVAMTRFAAFTLGAAISIGGAPVVDQLVGGQPNLIIENDCYRNLEYTPLGISIHSGEPKDLIIPPIVVEVEHLGDRIRVVGSHGPVVELSAMAGVEILIDDQRLQPGDSRRIDLGDGRVHILTLSC
jgi:hypothetical protein